MKRIIALVLCLMMVLPFVACNEEAPAETTPSVQQTEAPTGTTEAPADETTEAPADETTEAPADETTEAPAETTGAVVQTPVQWDELSADQQAALKAVMPVALPDLSSYEIVSRTMCFDKGTDFYAIEGNSMGSAEFVDVAGGAIFGQAVKMAAKADAKDARAEIQILPIDDMDISTAKGVMFYVDFSNVQIATDATTGEFKKMCTSVTINTNKYRSKGPNNGNGDSSAVAYYYQNGTWVQTTNINACRMAIPDNFAGWLYVPASTFYGSDEGAALGETFGDIFVMNMRCYTDGYVYSADSYIIFDEIVFIK